MSRMEGLGRLWEWVEGMCPLIVRVGGVVGFFDCVKTQLVHH